MRGRRFVALCDVLGFSEMVRTEDLNSLVERYKALLARTRYETRLSIRALSKTGDLTSRLEAETRVFSDSILVWSRRIETANADTFSQASVFLTAISQLVGSGLAVKLPLRIGVAYGDCFIDPDANIYVGQAILDAHETEQRQDWIGVACHPSCLTTPFSTELASLTERYQAFGGMIAAAIPVKRCPAGPPLIHALDWPYYIPKGVDRTEIESLLDAGRKAFASNRRASRKWSRGLRFFRQRRHAHESYKR